jgi:hypothetical protein
MKKKMMEIAMVLAILLAMSGSAHAQWNHEHNPPPPTPNGPTSPTPDTCQTSLLLAGAAGGLGLLRKYMR